MIKYSVIIPTYNRAHLLKQCLEAVARQTVPHSSYEIIVINDGSRDHTDRVVKEFQKNHPKINFIYLKQNNHGVSHARNQGIKRAKGEIIFFTDDDCVVPPNWIKALVDGYFRHPETVGVGGWYEYSDDVLQNSSYATYTTYEFKTRFPINQEIKTSHFITPVGNTSNMSYRKSALDAARGFDEEMCLPGFDDWELKIRIIDLGKPLLYLPIFVMHYHPLSTVDIAKRIFNFGRGRYKFLQKHPDLWRWYYPYFGRLMDYIIPQIPINRLDLRSMAIVQFALTRLGWEYQKIREHLTTDT